jgi:hypothetical protein
VGLVIIITSSQPGLISVFLINGFLMCSVKNFWETNSPLPEISVKGTLFFDLLHAKGGTHAGNHTIKTKTFWEIHPATYIRFWN